jgi:hypothetical protein
MGLEETCSIAAKATKSTPPAANAATTVPLDQPSGLPRIRAKTRANNAPLNVAAPSQSGRARRRRVSATRATSTHSAATGAFTKNTQRQLTPEVSAPPISGPTATEAPAVAPQIPSAVPRSRPRNSWAISASDVANIAAPPTPWSALKAFSITGPDASPQSSDETRNTTRPAPKTARWPSRSPSEPQTNITAASDSAYASIVHCRSLKDAPRSPAMLGSATLTIVMSSNSMNRPRDTVSSVHHLRATVHLLRRSRLPVARAACERSACDARRCATADPPSARSSHR